MGANTSIPNSTDQNTLGSKGLTNEAARLASDAALKAWLDRTIDSDLHEERESLTEKLRSGYLDVTVGYEQPVIHSRDTSKIASAFMSGANTRRMWKLVWTSVDQALIASGVKDSNKRDLILRLIKKAITTKDNQIDVFEENTHVPLIRGLFVKYGHAEAADSFEHIFNSLRHSFLYDGQLKTIGSDIGVDLNYSPDGKHNTTAGERSVFIKKLYQGFSQTAATYGSDKQVKNAVTRPFHIVTYRPKRLIQAQGANAMRSDLRDFFSVAPGSQSINGIMNQPGFDNIVSNPNSLVKRGDTSSIETFLGGDKYKLYNTLLEKYKSSVPKTLTLDV